MKPSRRAAVYDRMSDRRVMVLCGAMAALGLAGVTSAAAQDIVGRQRFAAEPQHIARCLVDNEGRAAYPRGQGPQFTRTVATAEGLRVEVWFFARNRALWRSDFDLLRSAGGTEVTVRMPVEPTIARDYGRAANELLAWCARLTPGAG